MKLPFLCTATAALFITSVAQAGGLGGPPAFTNLSPLQSGIDGSYQATARGENLTGVIRFAYQGQVQSPIPSANSYVFFVNGSVVSGNVTASITGRELAGILGGENFTIPTNDEGSIDLPVVFVIRGNRANGEFTGNIDLNDRMSYFSGSGQVTSAPAEEVTFIGIDDVESTDFTQGGVVITQGTIIIPESNVDNTDFTFEGVRTSVVAQGSFQDNSSSTTSQQQ